MGFDFRIKYKRGSENRVADILLSQDKAIDEGFLMAVSSPANNATH